MSRTNKFNPGQYTQAGRLTPDDAAREMKKQREAASPGDIQARDYTQKHKSRVTDEDKSEDEEEEGTDEQDE